jgi:hypothetical protein
MKKQLKLIMFLSVLLFTIFTACKKNDSVITPSSSSLSATISADANSSTLSPAKPMQIIITEVMDFSTNPALGTFSSTGALNIYGTCTMTFNPNENFTVAHNVITLTTSAGTITIHDECEFAVSSAFPFGKGQWQIVSGTGAYANLRGNGAESFPNDTDDVLTGIVY